jgi:hypothetical protein
MVVAHAAHDVLIAGPVALGLVVLALLTWRAAREARRDSS